MNKKRNDVFVTYRHLRNNETDAEGKNPLQNAGITLAIKVDLRNEYNRVVYFDFTCCDFRFDNFCKEEGRRIAYLKLKEKLKEGRAYSITMPENGYTIVNGILCYIQDHPEDFNRFTKYFNKYIN